MQLTATNSTKSEGLVVGENISMGDLKGTLEMIIKKMFGEDRKIQSSSIILPIH